MGRQCLGRRVVTAGDLRRPLPRGPSAEPRWRRGSGAGEGKKKKEGGGKVPLISIASYNVCDGRNGGLQLAGRALDRAIVDIAVLQEVKITDPKIAARK